MLKLIDTLEPQKIYIESDYCIPVKVRFEPWNDSTEPCLCSSILSNDKKSLFEIGIGEKPGKLKYITLVTCKAFHIGVSPQKTKKSVPRFSGLSVFETKKWSPGDYYTREIFDFDVYLNKPNISIILFSREIEKIFYNERVFFGFDKDDILCSIEVKNMPEDEWAFLEESLGLRPYPVIP